jgi:hypothetical protein
VRDRSSCLRRTCILAGLLVLLLSVAHALHAQLEDNYDHGVIAYSKSSPTDPIARLQRRIDSGTATLKFDSHSGYLPAILRELNIPASSQSLVFSRTSFQSTEVAPQRPRAIYFNDEVYVGYVQGSRLLEFASVDPKLGAIFYTLDEESKGSPRFQRELYSCLICHDSSSITGGVPGFMTLSVLPDREGNAIRSAPVNVMSDQTPFRERWGGWYVTGAHGKQPHRGNTIFPKGVAAMFEEVDGLHQGANLAILDDRINTADYLTRHSDIVALIALTHQTRMHNLMTRAQYETRQAIHQEENVARELQRSSDSYSSITQERIRAAVEPLVRGMFFVNEARFDDGVRGASGFAADFQKSGIRDRRGRSLKDLDLNRRFLRYPLSYLIYSPAFDALPDPAKHFFYDRIRTILSGVETSNFGHLSKEDRVAIFEILRDTKPDFARGE